MVHDVGAARLVDFVGAFAFNVVLEQVNHRAARGAQRESHVRQLPGHVKHPVLVSVIHGNEDFAFRRQGIECADLGFAKAMSGSGSMPITSPVDFISGPSTTSMPGKRPHGKTASFTQ